MDDNELLMVSFSMLENACRAAGDGRFEAAKLVAQAAALSTSGALNKKAIREFYDGASALARACGFMADRKAK